MGNFKLLAAERGWAYCFICQVRHFAVVFNSIKASPSQKKYISVWKIGCLGIFTRHLSRRFSCPMSNLSSELFCKANDKFGSIPATHRNKIIRPGTSISFPYLNIFFSSRLTLNKTQSNVFTLFLLSLTDNKTSFL